MDKIIPGTWQNALVGVAIEASRQAHCPYSKFHVGAAVLCTDGTIVKGCNVENASYGLTVCAERVAIWSAIAQGKRPTAIAVACPNAAEGCEDKYRMPCGACRQVMTEFMPQDAPVIVASVGIFKVSEILPKAFSL